MDLESLNEQVKAKKLSELFYILPIISGAGLFLAGAIVYSLENISTNHLLGWGVGVLALFASHVFISLLARKQLKLNLSLTKWQIVAALSFFLLGVFWSSGLTFLLSQSEQNKTPFLIMASVVVVACHFPVFINQLKFFLIFLVPFAWFFGTAHIDIQDASAWLVLFSCFLVIMILISGWSSKKANERILAQFKLAEQNELVEAANQSKSQFLASASHDLRQPLQALGFYIVMLSDFLREPKKKAIFDKTLNAYQALESLLNQLLNISKLNANLIEINEIDFSIKSLFDKLNNDYELQAIDKGLSIVFESNDEYAYSDSVSVERILRNLIENALRYTKNGSIIVSAIEKEEQVELSVKDSGIGIHKAHLEKIFDEFYQVKNPERDRNKGFGLGLYAVAKLTLLLNSDIKVESEPELGSRFSFILPEGKKPIELERINIGNEVDDSVLQDQVVFIVDDDEVVLDSVSRLVLSWGALVLTASSYDEAIELLRIEEIIPDFMIVDFRLPRHKNGVDLIDQIRSEMQVDIPAVVLTGDTGKDSLEFIARSGIKLLNKPTNPKVLKQQVKSQLNKQSVAV